MSCFPFKCYSVVPSEVAVKIWDAKRKRRIGLCAKSMHDLNMKIVNKFKLPKTVQLNIVLEEDGTEVEDDIFLELPQHTILMVLEKGETWTPAPKNTADDIESALCALIQSNDRHRVTEEVVNKIKKKHSQLMLELLGQIVTAAKQNIHANTCEEDPDWFKDYPANKTTKDAAMRECAKRRIRKYYYMAIDYVKTKKRGKVPADYQQLFNNFHKNLKSNDFYGNYFDRTVQNPSQRFCDHDGWFICEGKYNMVACSHLNHRINPYGSRVNYIMFSTWNLDHKIENFREILPQLMLAQQKIPKGKVLNWCYFYDLLFTRSNLFLVHITCHDKTEHKNEKCDPKQYYV